jgi:1-phosphofructokinase family hexose kinase
MIVTVTLNPAIDQTLVLPRFVAGDTIRVRSSRFDPGGKGINVSRVIRILGGESVAMGFAPGGRGRYIEQTLQANTPQYHGITCDFVHTRGETRTNITILDETRHMHTILSDPGPDTDPHAVKQLTARLRKRLRAGDWLVLAGSIPPPIDPEIYGQIVAEAHDRGAHTVLDADGAALEAGISARPDLVKANRRELERLVGRHLDDEKSTLEAAETVHRQGVKSVVVTRGRDGAVVVSDDFCLRGVAPRVRSVSAVGSGDSLLAGVVFTLSQGGSLEAGLRLGIAAGTATVLTPGTELCHRREVDILLPRVKIQPIDTSVACGG